jgi:Sec-independent protein translocase protein TatA
LIEFCCFWRWGDLFQIVSAKNHRRFLIALLLKVVLIDFISFLLAALHVIFPWRLPSLLGAILVSNGRPQLDPNSMQPMQILSVPAASASSTYPSESNIPLERRNSATQWSRPTSADFQSWSQKIVIRSGIELIKDLPFAFVSLILFPTVYRVIIMSDNINKAKSDSKKRYEVLSQVKEQIIDFPFIILSILLIVFPWRFGLFIRELRIHPYAVGRRRSVGWHFILSFFDIIMLPFIACLLVGFYRLPRALRRHRTLTRTFFQYMWESEERFICGEPEFRLLSVVTTLTETGIRMIIRAEKEGGLSLRHASVSVEGSEFLEAFSQAFPQFKYTTNFAIVPKYFPASAFQVGAVSVCQEIDWDLDVDRLTAFLDSIPSKELLVTVFCDAETASLHPLLTFTTTASRILRSFEDHGSSIIQPVNGARIVSDTHNKNIRRIQPFDCIHPHLIFISEGLEVLLDLPFIIMGMFAAVSPWQRTFLKDILNSMSPATARLLCLKGFVSTIIDLPFLLLFLLIHFIGIWRVPQLWWRTRTQCTNAQQYRKVCLETFGSVLVDYLFIVVGLVLMVIGPHRFVMMIVDVSGFRKYYRGLNASDRRLCVLEYFLLAILDPFAILSLIVVTVTYYRRRLAKDLCLIHNSGTWHWYRFSQTAFSKQVPTYEGRSRISNLQNDNKARILEATEQPNVQPHERYQVDTVPTHEISDSIIVTQSAESTRRLVSIQGMNEELVATVPLGYLVHCMPQPTDHIDISHQNYIAAVSNSQLPVKRGDLIIAVNGNWNTTPINDRTPFVGVTVFHPIHVESTIQQQSWYTRQFQSGTIAFPPTEAPLLLGLLKSHQMYEPEFHFKFSRLMFRCGFHFILIVQLLEMLVKDLVSAVCGLCVLMSIWRTNEFWKAISDVTFKSAYQRDRCENGISMVTEYCGIDFVAMRRCALHHFVQLIIDIPFICMFLVVAVLSTRLRSMYREMHQLRASSCRAISFKYFVFAAILDPIALVLGFPVALSWRSGQMFYDLMEHRSLTRTRESSAIGNLQSWSRLITPHCIVVHHAIALIIDLPFVLMFIIVTLFVYRAPSLWNKVLFDGKNYNVIRRIQYQFSRFFRAPSTVASDTALILDEDVLQFVFANLDGLDIARCERVCTTWRRVLTAPSSEMLWKQICQRYKLLPTTTLLPAYAEAVEAKRNWSGRWRSRFVQFWMSSHQVVQRSKRYTCFQQFISLIIGEGKHFVDLKLLFFCVLIAF